MAEKTEENAPPTDENTSTDPRDKSTQYPSNAELAYPPMLDVLGLKMVLSPLQENHYAQSSSYNNAAVHSASHPSVSSFSIGVLEPNSQK